VNEKCLDNLKLLRQVVNMAQAIEKSMKEIFHKAQFNKTDHPQYIKKLMKLYEKVNSSYIVLNCAFSNELP